MDTDVLLRGQRVRLTALDKADAAPARAWTEDAGYLRLLDSAPALPRNLEQVTRDLERAASGRSDITFAIRPLDGDELLGIAALSEIEWNNQLAWLSIGIGDQANRGKGYGREAMTLLIDFAFRELNLRRLQLTVFSYNTPAIALYEKLGFHREGVMREVILRDGQTYDMYCYGLLRREWQNGFLRNP
ncbi:MAG: GNAT family N-acetyltransferase [Anaerolineae bacterium]|nr:GNAT family N-acetyltransferase [Anaerolineae bacterium]